MPIYWGQLPLEMRQAIVKEMTVGTSNGCVIMFDHKRENEYLWVLVKERGDGGSMVYVTSINPAYSEYAEPKNEKYSTKTGWREAFMKIMSLIGTKITVGSLTITPDKKFNKMFKWFRRNIQLNPHLVSISVDLYADHYDESIWSWPSHSPIHLTVVDYCRFPNLEGFNIYDKIVSLNYREGNYMTDEELKKFRNAKYVKLYNCAVTINGFVWWFMKWMTTRTNDKEEFSFYMRFKCRQEIRLENLKNKLSCLIEKIDRCIVVDLLNFSSEKYWEIKIKKNEKAEGTIRLFDDKIEFESDIVDA